MIKIKSDNGRAIQLVSELVELIESCNGFVHSHLQLQIQNGELSLSRHKKLEAGESVIVLPLECMTILSDFDYQLDNGRIQATCKADRVVSYAQRQALELSLELYNLFDKVEAYSRSCPPIQLRQFNHLIQMLLKATSADEFAEQGFRSLADFKVFCFWSNRAFHHYESGTDRLIPFLEFADHHSFADGYRMDASSVAGTSVNLRYEPAVKKQVLVCYSALDALTSFIKYGFYDRSAFFVQSIPFSMHLPGFGELYVDHQDANVFQLPLDDWIWQPRFKNSLFYASQLRQGQGSELSQISFCLIPPERHIPALDDALAHQMALIERLNGLNAGTLNTTELIREFKVSLIGANKRFLQQVVKSLKTVDLDLNTPIVMLLKTVLRHQMKIIKQFEKQAL